MPGGCSDACRSVRCAGAGAGFAARGRELKYAVRKRVNAVALTLSLLAMVFVGLRVLHGVFYIANLHVLRSAVWSGGFAVVAWLMVQAALKVV